MNSSVGYKYLGTTLTNIPGFINHDGAVCLHVDVWLWAGVNLLGVDLLKTCFLHKSILRLKLHLVSCVNYLLFCFLFRAHIPFALAAHWSQAHLYTVFLSSCSLDLI